MPATIVQRLFDGTPDNKVTINNCSIARKLLPIITDQWNHLRLATRVAINYSSATWIIDSPVFAMGLCAGVTNPWNNGLFTTTHFVGCKTTAVFWLPAPPPDIGRVLLTVDGDWRAMRRVGTTEHIEGSGPGQGISILGFPMVITDKRDMLCIDFVRSGSNILINSFFNNEVNTPDVPYDDFIDIVAHLSPSWPRLPAVSQYAWGQQATMAVDEGANGVLDSVNFASDRVNHIELSDAVVVRFG